MELPPILGLLRVAALALVLAAAAGWLAAKAFGGPTRRGRRTVFLVVGALLLVLFCLVILPRMVSGW